MARGWESKSIESQIEAAESKPSAPKRTPLTPEQLSKLRERESLESSRARVLRDLESAGNPKYREILQAALLHLDQKLAALA